MRRCVRSTRCNTCQRRARLVALPRAREAHRDATANRGPAIVMPPSSPYRMPAIRATPADEEDAAPARRGLPRRALAAVLLGARPGPRLFDAPRGLQDGVRRRRRRHVRHVTAAPLSTGARFTREKMASHPTTFVIPTYRLRDVGETIERYDDNFWRNGHSTRIVVFDDSSLATHGQVLPTPRAHEDAQRAFLRGPQRKGRVRSDPRRAVGG